MTLCGVIIINTCLKINSALLWDSIWKISEIGHGNVGDHTLDCEQWTYAERKSFNCKEGVEQRRHTDLESSSLAQS